jgi:hypothetical protein
MNWKSFLKNLLHAAAGAAASMAIAAGTAYVGLPHVNPVVAAAIGSALSSIGSLNSMKPLYGTKQDQIEVAQTALDVAKDKPNK